MQLLFLHFHENDDCHAVALRASFELSQSADCPSVRSRGWSELLQSAGDCQSERSRVLVPTIHTLRGTGTFPLVSTNHLEKGKSGYVPTNTCPFTKGKGQVKLDPQNLQQHATVTQDDLMGTPNE